jgi:exopolysaccharide biosynthesis polyprenyl glycosylphosphotransferase
MPPMPLRLRSGVRREERDFAIDALMLVLAATFEQVASPLAEVPELPIPWVILYGLAVLALLGARRMYAPRITPGLLEDVRGIVAATAIAAMMVGFLRLLFVEDAEAAASAVRLWAFSVAYLVAARGGVRLAEVRSQRGGVGAEPTLIVGAGEVGHLIAKRLLGRPELGLEPVGFLDADPLEVEHPSGIPVLGTPDDVERIVATRRVSHAVFGFSSARHDADLALIRRLEALRVSVSIVPRLFERTPDRVALERLEGLPVLSIYPTNPRGWQFAVKYTFDRVIALLLIVLFAIPLALCALGVRATMGRPILFRQRRCALDGREFDILKFRTMRPLDPTAPQEMLEDSTSEGLAPGGIEGTDRRTPFGAFLRRTSLDELPQLFNVLSGEMTLVGPRPERPEYVNAFVDRIRRYDERHRIKPGITGWAQLFDRRTQRQMRRRDDPGRTPLAERIERDNYYIENWSLWLDIKIALLSLVAVIRDRSE